METCVTEPAGTVGRKGLFPGGSSRVRAINPSRSASAEPRRANPTAPADQQIRKRAYTRPYEQSDRQDPPLAAPRQEAEGLVRRNDARSDAREASASTTSDRQPLRRHAFRRGREGERGGWSGADIARVGLPTGIACDQGKIAFQATVAGLSPAYLSRRAL